MNPLKSMQAIYDFLLCETPDAWVEQALKEPDLLLIDHANCEKKAASTALNLMYRYVDNFPLLNKMSRLAREELRHFEQVLAIMAKRNIAYPQLTASRYATEIRKPVRTSEPGKLVDNLIVGAIIEARSCERFSKLAPHLDAELQQFYLSLLKSESRHFKDYLTLAESASDEPIDQRVQIFLERDKMLVQSTDVEFRFHSGVPEQA
jgi:tRNA 2-(methylsulfanyl)-N6-isopentenyladenosine37 hydroxylase